MDCKLKEGAGYLIEGKAHDISSAMQYLQAQGFTRTEALEYIRTLPLEA
jgi:hypothetical protein